MSAPLDEASKPGISERILVFVKGHRDAIVTERLLNSDGFVAFHCASVAALAAAIDEGAGAVLLAEELLTVDAVRELRRVLDRQPPWSDLPIIVFSAPEGARRVVADHPASLGNVVFLDRPVRVRSMLAALHAAIASRRRQHDARRAIESRDAFLAMLGHELRNPLGAITLAVALIKEKVSPTEPLREHAILVRQTAHLTRIVDDLLDVARFTHGKIPVKREKVDLADVVRESFEAFQARAQQHRLAYSVALPGGAMWMDGDRQRLQQALSNLITNAIKYTRPGGSIRVVAKRDAGAHVVEVIDDGVGLADSMRGRVFEPFTQVEASLDRSEGGLGLGLALVRAVVSLHGGTVEALSEGIGRGSTFVVRLPSSSAGAAQAPSESDASARPMKRRRVLLVEDSADIRELFVEVIGDHDVACAEDGPKGLDALLSWSPDIAFVDIGLPGFDGFELARRARESGFIGRLVALTGYGQANDRRQALEAGFDDHFVKPVANSDIRRALLQANA